MELIIEIVEPTASGSNRCGFDGWTYLRRLLLLKTTLTEVEFIEADGEGNA